ncbi:MAG: hypothetical protein WBC33_07670 [Conexibacter sp.]
MGADGDEHLVRGQWRHEVAVRIRELEGRLAEAKARRASEHSEVSKAQVAAVARALKDAERAIAYDCCALRRIQHWWTGAALTRAWESVHVAEAALVRISGPMDRAEAVPRLRAWLKLVLSSRDVLHRYEAHFDAWESSGRPDQIVLRQAYQTAIAANIEWHTSLRAFRNVLFYVAGGLLILLLVLAGWHAFDPDVLPLCEARDGASGGFCGTAPWQSVLEVEFVGAFGGLLSSAFLIAKLEKPPARYNVLAPQIMLKAVAGAASALVGLLFLQSEVLVRPVDGRSTAALLTYAIVFGFSQQLVTQLIDRQSVSLLSPAGGAAERGQTTRR